MSSRQPELIAFVRPPTHDRGCRILAAVVTYNPGPELASHLRAVGAECDQVLVIDNGSTALHEVQEAVRVTGCTLLANHANLGIASALEHAARHARQHGFDWLITFDQDSACPPGGVDGLLALYEQHPQRDRIAVVCLAQRDRATGREYHHRLDILEETPAWRLLRTTITSGCMVRVALLPETGAFEERLFIDFVDHAFCLRLRRRGYLIVEDRRHVLDHAIGRTSSHRLFGMTLVTTNHPPVRVYYINRNRLEVCSRNLLFDPVWSLKGLAQVFSGLALIMLLEQDRPKKLRYLLRGMLDFARRRFGPYV